MAFLIDIVNSVKSYVWGNPPLSQAPPKKTIVETFRENLSQCSAILVGPEECKECAANCCKRVSEDLLESDCDLSNISQQTIAQYLTQFDKEVDETKYLVVDEVIDLKAAFKEALEKLVQDKWAILMARSFHPLLKFSNTKEQVQAAQKWTQQFFDGVQYFGGRRTSLLDGDFVAKLQQKTSLAFHAYSYEVKQAKVDRMSNQMEKDQIAFARKMEAAIEKAERNPTSLTAEEAEFVELAETLASSLTQYWPGIEHGKEMLKQCVWLGFTLQGLKQSFFNDTAERLFADKFKKDKT